MKRNFLLIGMLFLSCFMMSCMPKTVTDYPEIERPLQLTELYLDLYEQYELLYDFSGQAARQDMKKHIAPLMNSTKNILTSYNEIVLSGGKDAEKQRLIMQKLREISYRLSEVEDESK